MLDCLAYTACQQPPFGFGLDAPHGLRKIVSGDFDLSLPRSFLTGDQGTKFLFSLHSSICAELPKLVHVDQDGGGISDVRNAVLTHRTHLLLPSCTLHRSSLCTRVKHSPGRHWTCVNHHELTDFFNPSSNISLLDPRGPLEELARRATEYCLNLNELVFKDDSGDLLRGGNATVYLGRYQDNAVGALGGCHGVRGFDAKTFQVAIKTPRDGPPGDLDNIKVVLNIFLQHSSDIS